MAHLARVGGVTAAEDAVLAPEALATPNVKGNQNAVTPAAVPAVTAVTAADAALNVGITGRINCNTSCSKLLCSANEERASER